MKTIKSYLILFAIILFIALSCSLGILFNEYTKQKAEIKRQTINLSEIGKDYSKLILTKDELKDKVIKSDKRIQKADSLLKTKNIKITQLEHLHVTTVTIFNTDTTFLTNTDTLLVRDSLKTELCKTPFVDNRNCIKIEGFVLSTDSFPSVAITSQNAEIETYDIDVHRRWFQFWKPRTWKETYTKCGDLKVLDVKIKK